jgi:hypothetical protein
MTNTQTLSPQSANYGIDGPIVLGNLIIIAIAAIVLGFFVH